MRRRPIPPVDELLRALGEAGVADAPQQGPDDDALRGLLDLALFVAEHRKRVSFDSFRWDDPGFTARDAKVELRFAYATLPGDTPDALDLALRGSLDRIRDARTLLALDAHRTRAREFELTHHLYGAVTLFSWPTKPVEPADPRIDDAREKGWARTLKQHNLLPGRGIVVLDEHQGVLLREGEVARVPGILALLPDGQTHLWWNPFAPGADSELQYWLAWGEGHGGASEWREQLYAEERE